MGQISYPGEYDLMVQSQKYSGIFSYNMHQDTKSARLIAVCKRSLSQEPNHRARAPRLGGSRTLSWLVGQINVNSWKV